MNFACVSASSGVDFTAPKSIPLVNTGQTLVGVHFKAWQGYGAFPSAVTSRKVPNLSG